MHPFAAYLVVREQGRHEPRPLLDSLLPWRRRERARLELRSVSTEPDGSVAARPRSTGVAAA